MKKYLKLMRISHYLKNGLIFIPLLFSQKLFEQSYFVNTFFAMIAFCLTSSCVYILNDMKDIKEDRKHPIKKNRPLANRSISIRNAIFLLIGLFLISLLILLKLQKIMPIIYLSIYFVLNIIYSFGAKNIPIVDLIILVSGFVFRVLYGGAVCDIQVSNWLFLTILSISTYLAIGKRAKEYKNMKPGTTRKVLQYYNEEFLTNNMNIFLAISIVFYSLWTIERDIQFLIYTVPIVMVLALRYSLNLSNNGSGDPIDMILHDKFILSLGIFYICMIFLTLYIF